MKRAMIVLFIMLLCAQMGFSAANSTVYEPYGIDEFPDWSLKLRRGETLLFGSLPITLSLTGLSYSLALGLGAGKFSDDPFKESLTVFGIAAGLSLIIAITDFILGELEK
jgi:hypothetical protein